MTVLVLCEHDNNTVKPTTYNAIAAALHLGDTVDILVTGFNCQSVADEALKIGSVGKIHFYDNESLEHFSAEAIAQIIADIAGAYNYIIAADTAFGKNVMPRAAGLCDVQQITGITKVVDANTFERPIYAGNAIATVKTGQDRNFITVRTTAFDEHTARDGSASIENGSVPDITNMAKFVKADIIKLERPELTSASIVISGGRGLGSAENFKMIENLADKLGAAVGASRAAVDAGYVPNDYQVGQTGKVVAPSLYIAVGISGAIQHLAGMKDSKVIVAINKDEEAPIFSVADYGLVDDLFTVVPELNEKLG